MALAGKAAIESDLTTNVGRRPDDPRSHPGNRREASNARREALFGGADWAQTGTSGASAKSASLEARQPRRRIPLL